MTEFDIRELLEGFEENSIEIREKEIVSADKIKEDVMDRIDKTALRKARKWTSAGLAAAICAVALAGTALAVGLLQLDERRGDVIIPEESLEMEGYVAITPSEESSNDIVYTDVNAIGVTGSPEYLAAKEWNDWCLAHIEDNVLFPDGASEAEKNAISADAWDDIHVYMLAYTDEAKEALDTILEKYGLRLPESYQTISQKDLYEMTGGLAILPLDANSFAGSWYEGGALTIHNKARLESGKTLYYDLIRSVKGVFFHPHEVLVEQDITEEWQYTTSDGTTVTLDLGTNQSVLMAELPNSFVYVDIRGGTENNDETRDFTGPDTLTRADLEAFAELIDFKTLDSIQ